MKSGINQMKTVSKIVYVWAIFAILFDLMTILTPDVEQTTKQQAAGLGIFNCCYLLWVHKRTWTKEDEKKTPTPK